MDWPIQTDVTPKSLGSRSSAGSRNIGFRFLVLGVAATAATALAFGQARLNRAATRDHLSVEQSLKVEGLVRTVDGIEWRAVASEGDKAEATKLRKEFQDVRSKLMTSFSSKTAAPELASLRKKTSEYLSAVSDLLTAIAEGDSELASEIDEERVDPGFENIIETVEFIVETDGAQALATEAKYRRLTFVSTLGMGTLLGASMLLIFGSRERRKRREIEIESAQRFQSIVQSSEDLFTVVRHEQSISLISPTLGPFIGTGCDPEPVLVCDFLPDDARLDWSVLDNRLLLSGGRQEGAFKIQRPDGSFLWLEAHGTAIGSGERAWVWRDITERKELELQLTHQAFHDPLTGVANRSLLRDRVEHALAIAFRSSSPVNLLFCDLDDFKTVNDTLGHAEGDELLSVITKRIQGCVRDGDTVARLGGDEFAILLEDTDPKRALALAERLLSVIGYEVKLAGRTVFPSMSIGIATSSPATTPDELLRNADLAMYSAKRSGKGRSAVYQDAMHKETDDKLGLQTALKTALANGEFSVHFQPTIDLRSGVVEGVEALLRWDSPTQGSVSPVDFIPVAEAHGMIIPIGRFVLMESCRAAVALQAEHDEPLLMHVNLSPQQLHDPSIVETVRNALVETNLAPHLLVLEITEGVLLDDPLAVQRLHQLHELGVLIAIDDFGTGYTSISYLQNLPIQILKIDRSFVSGDALADSERIAFLSAIVGLAKSLNLRSVAEGIEQADQLAELRGLGCHSGQGYLWARAEKLDTTKAAIRNIELNLLGAEVS
jgi:diguanylate cyclase (GGDEF)-like protein/PAS domain S-box-containing protein